MYAVAIYDNREERLVLARDPTGIKPLYYVETTDGFAFASEPVALIKGYVGTLRREDATWNQQILDDSLAVIEDEADRRETRRRSHPPVHRSRPAQPLTAMSLSFRIKLAR